MRPSEHASRRATLLVVSFATACGVAAPSPRPLERIAELPPPAIVPAPEPERPTTARRGTASFDAVIAALAEAHAWLRSYDARDGVSTLEVRGEAHAIVRFAERLALALDDVAVVDVRPLSPDPDLREAKVRARARGAHDSLAVRSSDEARPLVAAGQRNPFEPWPRALRGSGVAEDSAASALSLIAILPGDGGGRAMLVDASKMSWVVRAGDLVGRAPCRYRVAEVGAAAVHLVRADATCAEPPQRILHLKKP